MGQIPRFLSALVSSVYAGRRTAKARKDSAILRCSGSMDLEEQRRFVSAFSRRGEKGVNQDCSVVWKKFGHQEDLTFCGIFDGHGAWGKEVAKMISKFFPSLLLCNWQEILATSETLSLELDPSKEKKLSLVDIWSESYTRACVAMDAEIEHNRSLDSFYSGSTALSVIVQGDVLVLANVGDSRAVLGTLDINGLPVPVQLTVDFKPSLPQEAERIRQSKGRVFCLEDEPGVLRLWRPCGETPGLAMSRAFGDFCVKDFGLISTPHLTHHVIAPHDLFLLLATDGVWDVVSNQEAVQIVHSAPDKRKAAKLLVQHAVAKWRRVRKGIAVDDCSAVCLFFCPP